MWCPSWASKDPQKGICVECVGWVLWWWTRAWWLWISYRWEVLKEVDSMMTHFSSDKFSQLSRVQLFATPWTAACQASLSIINSWSPPKPCPSSRWCHPAFSSSVVPFSSCPQSLSASESFPMGQLFPWGGQSIGVSALASVLPKNTQDWSLRMDWLDLLAVQGTLKSLLQHHSSKASILQHSAFFRIQLSHPYMTTGKTIALTRLACCDSWGRKESDTTEQLN